MEELGEFIHLFNQQRFFEAHEVLELRWRQEKGESRDFYHGLIQIAAAFVHLQKGTPEGAKELLRTAGQYLEKYRPAYQGISLEKLLAETRACLEAGNGLHRNFPLL